MKRKFAIVFDQLFKVVEFDKKSNLPPNSIWSTFAQYKDTWNFVWSLSIKKKVFYNNQYGTLIGIC